MLWWFAFVASVVLANVLVLTVGIVPVGFGLYAPAGVVLIGGSFWIRDHLHRALGLRGVGSALLVGALVSALASPALALASLVAFLVSEGLDTAVFAALQRRSWVGAVVASNVVGIVADSVLFLLVAFGSLAYLPGQLWVKAWWTIAFLGWRASSRLAGQDRHAAHGVVAGPETP